MPNHLHGIVIITDGDDHAVHGRGLINQNPYHHHNDQSKRRRRYVEHDEKPACDIGENHQAFQGEKPQNTSMIVACDSSRGNAVIMNTLYAINHRWTGFAGIFAAIPLVGRSTMKIR